MIIVTVFVTGYPTTVATLICGVHKLLRSCEFPTTLIPIVLVVVGRFWCPKIFGESEPRLNTLTPPLPRHPAYPVLDKPSDGVSVDFKHQKYRVFWLSSCVLTLSPANHFLFDSHFSNPARVSLHFGWYSLMSFSCMFQTENIHAVSEGTNIHFIPQPKV